MTYVAAEAKQSLLDQLGDAIDELSQALSALGEAYEQLDERNADRLEEELFQPVQAAFGQAKRTHAGFAERQGLPGREFSAAGAGLPSTGAKGFVEAAVGSVTEADAILSELQDSMLPVEVGDPEVRSGLAAVRELLAVVGNRAREIERTRGR